MMEPRTENELVAVFNTLVKEASTKFGKKPLVDLVESTDDIPVEDIDSAPGTERALLHAHVVKEEQGEVTIFEGLVCGIRESEIDIVGRLVEKYEQPDPEFRTTVDNGYWKMWGLEGDGKNPFGF